MASSILVRVPVGQALRGLEPAQQHWPSFFEGLVADALEGFHDVERICSRFDAASPLSRANEDPSRWHRGPSLLVEALCQASEAHLATGGRFDPRVHDALVAHGYTAALRFEEGHQPVVAGAVEALPSGTSDVWRPRLISKLGCFHLRGRRVDLGGIGKGLAVRWAAERLGGHVGDFLVEAGGDCYCSGATADGEAWRIAVEDPFGATDPVAVLEASNCAVATSSIRLRHWQAGDEVVHHLIDPRTSRPGGQGLAAVTVLADDPAWAEVWSKALFLEGADRIAAVAEEREIAALWIDASRLLHSSSSLARSLIWKRR